MKKTTRILLAAAVTVLALGVLALPASAAGTTDYEIQNPYANVDWDTWHAYKTQLHCHTIASDGDVQLNDVVELHYELGYDALAITDHAIVGKPWDEVPQTVPLFRLVKYERTQMADVVPLTTERFEEIQNGVGRDGRGMLYIPKGIELNGAVPSNSHLTGYYSDYGQGLLGVDGDYETPVREVGIAGGITMLSHLGNYMEYYEKLYPEMENDPGNINKFASIFLENPSCVGMDIDSGTDSHTFRDRVLYDNVLQQTIPNGVVPWCFSFSDAHQLGQYDRAFTVHMMTELTTEEQRRSMEEGTLFAISRHARTEMGNDFVGEGAHPMVTRVTVDDEANTITLDTVNSDKIVWVANGVEIAQGNTIDLNDYEGHITCYVRAYVTGAGGVCFVQPFVVNIKGTQFETFDVDSSFGLSNFLRFLINVLDKAVFQNSVVVDVIKDIALGL